MTVVDWGISRSLSSAAMFQSLFLWMTVVDELDEADATEN